ncbi:MAG: lipid-A-disaccharide synthase [Gammaproteobacteria bacterium CG11_big_fil_rev_8_21_14_0_20_46_22]|nr:MAG: lipid-A-disaccharide synthase [Gammaproteobacteria bacterium CG12_big_fil_rev_8_21_14_0_65_46_12]PIR12042.1 MAG: lipid-A-disaccharide synthase [Gammaproteobacteria bacterium CG11_big_fil_rev_8_21_14_0_20_46_22]
MKNKAPHIFICAGEASGDTLGSLLAADLKQHQPDIKLAGMGGDKMKAEGVDVVFPYDDIAVVGLIEVITHFSAIKKAYNTVKTYLLEQKPDLVVFIDYPGFNLRMAKVAKEAGIRVMYYVSPQIWAWKKGRIHHIKRYVDHMAVLFAFEKELYESAGVPASFVGHPLTHKVQASESPESLRTRFGLKPGQKVIALLPGSRRGEIERLAPCMAATLSLLRKKHPSLQCVIPLAPTIDAKTLPAELQKHAKIVKGETYNALAVSDAAITASGTATLEVALMGVPMAIIYKVNLITYLIARLVVKISHIGLCNIITQREVAPEFIQFDMTPEKIAAYIDKLLSNESFHHTQKAGLEAVALQLKSKSETHTPAEVALSLVDH